MLYLDYLFLIFEWSACKLAGQAKCSFHYKQAFLTFNDPRIYSIDVVSIFSQDSGSEKISPKICRLKG